MARTKIMTAALIALVALPLGAADIPSYIPTISVSGTAEVSMQPDTASFDITASFVENTTEEARARTSQMINSAVEILTSEFEVIEDDLSSTYISCYPEYQWKDDERVLVGQRASQTLSVKLHDLDIIGDVYQRLMSLDGISLSDVSLDKADKSYEYREARMNAVQDAYNKASAYAEAAGVKIGSVLSISDGSSYAAPLYRSANLMLASAEAATADSIPTEFYTGDITVSANVSIVYAIAE
ncbi:MAG: SIMPL domain-containing protein [Spirochaetes bacterium]|uniref:SIMPL domain-containing protein n=1 Tax=Candidatus Ornithospirochaeta stercoripullorum TaxID=2840899 RepID=A0A9D9E0Q8_9SPIO|nr:SIMPL domain-containing protein [Candidatus Ornithospirochaeta stercoripullorum]